MSLALYLSRVRSSEVLDVIPPPTAQTLDERRWKGTLWRLAAPCAPRSPAGLASRRRRCEGEARLGARLARNPRGTHVLPWGQVLHCRIWPVKIRVARLGGCELDLDDGWIYDASMDTITISPTVHRQVIHDHLVACRPCRELLAYSRRAADGEALAAWRRQLAVHLEPPPRRRS